MMCKTHIIDRPCFKPREQEVEVGSTAFLPPILESKKGMSFPNSEFSKFGKKVFLGMLHLKLFVGSGLVRLKIMNS